MKVTVALLFAAICLGASHAQNKKPFLCYWQSWVAERPNNMIYSSDKIPVDLCTHIIYSFAGLDDATWKMKSLNPNYDFTKNGIKNFVNLRSKNPELKALIAIGGWSEGSGKYSRMAASPTSRKTFIDSVVAWLRDYDFDGIDIDWEYPGAGDRGGAPQDRQNFPILLKELRAALDAMGGRKRLLTIAVGVTRSKMNDGYDVKAIAPHVDYVNMMTYDLRGSWDNFADHQATLHKRPSDQGWHVELNVEDTMKLWADSGAPKNKLIMGIPMYGRTYTLQNPANNNIKAPTIGPGTKGDYTQEPGSLAYFELCPLIKSYSQGWDDVGKVPYMSQGNQWIAYDNERSIEHKVALLQKEGYGGAMVWAVDLDDFTGKCSGVVNPLVHTISKCLGGNVKPQPGPAPQPTPNPNPNPTPTPTVHPNPAPTVNPNPDSNPTCDNRADGQKFRIPPNCAVFYECVHGIPFKNECPSGLIFDEKAGVCNWIFATEDKTGCNGV